MRTVGCFCLALSFLLASCAIFAPRAAKRFELSVEERQNGYLIWLEMPGPVGDVAALIGRTNWVIITLADSRFPIDALRVFPTAHIESVDVERFESAVQVAVKLKKPVTAVEVIRMKDGRMIAISAFF